MIKRLFLVFLSSSMAMFTFAQSEELLKVLETPLATEAFMFFRAKYQLDNSLSESTCRTETYILMPTIRKIKTVMLTNANQNINQKTYSKYSGHLPFNLSFSYSLAIFALK
jgi:hypothetical protein